MQCSEKIRYLFHRDAVKAADRTRMASQYSKEAARAAESLEAYKCSRCTFWHVGHRPLDMRESCYQILKKNPLVGVA
jgi:hypothetical protein